jgi:hypothetical protein
LSIQLRFGPKEKDVARLRTTAALRVDDPDTEAEVTVKKLPPFGNDYHTEKRVIGNDNLDDRIRRWRGRTRVESMASRNFVNLIKVFFLSALALGLGLPHQNALGTPIMVGLSGKIALAFRRRQKRSSKDSSRLASTS